MRECYVLTMPSGRIAIADLTQVGRKRYYLNRINVPEPHRGEGFGSELLRIVLEDADDENVTIELEVYPSGPLDAQTLTDWYVRNGFKKTPQSTFERAPVREREVQGQQDGQQPEASSPTRSSR